MDFVNTVIVLLCAIFLITCFGSGYIGGQLKMLNERLRHIDRYLDATTQGLKNIADTGERMTDQIVAKIEGQRRD